MKAIGKHVRPEALRQKRIRNITARGLSRLTKCPESLAELFKTADASMGKARAQAGRPSDDPGVFAVRLLTAIAKRDGFSFIPPGYVLGWIEDGKVFLDKSRSLMWMLDAVEGVDVSRIKVCEVCDKPFWAGRRDRRGCSLAHSHVIATREWRQSYHEGGKGGEDSYKVQRYKRQAAEERET